jgi:hypothetical protein
MRCPSLKVARFSIAYTYSVAQANRQIGNDKTA